MSIAEEMGRGGNVEYTYASFKVEDGKEKVRFEYGHGEPSTVYIPVEVLQRLLYGRE